MTGELILKNSARWKHIVPAVLLTVGVAFGGVAVLALMMNLGTMNFAIIGAVLAYVLFRVAYPRLLAGLSGGSDRKTLRLSWSLTADTLTLGDTSLPRDNIKQVHCWPNRDALGHQNPGWIVNIETKTGRNQVLYSLDEGAEVEHSVETLHELVNALGYGEGWVKP